MINQENRLKEILNQLKDYPRDMVQQIAKEHGIDIVIMKKQPHSEKKISTIEELSDIPKAAPSEKQDFQEYFQKSSHQQTHKKKGQYSGNHSDNNLGKFQTHKYHSFRQQNRNDAPNNFVSDFFSLDQEIQEGKQEQKSNRDIIKQQLDILRRRHPESKTEVDRIERIIQQNQISKESINILNNQSLHSLLDITLNNQTLNGSLDNIKDPISQQSLAFLHKIAFLHKQKSYKNGKNVNKQTQKQYPLFLFLFSQPLIHIKPYYQKQDQDLLTPIQAIDYSKEVDTIVQIMKGTKIRFQKKVAEKETMMEWIQKFPEFIHFSGHGKKDVSSQLLHKRTYNNNKTTDALIFENGYGGSDYMCTQDLKQIIGKYNKRLKFVFVASCHSEDCGKVFKQAGADHVICIRRQYKILDDACQLFVKTFYMACIINNKTICQSFEFAKQSILLNFPRTQQRFMLQKQVYYNKHECSKLSNFEKGEFINLSYKPKYAIFPTRIQHFVGRNMEMFEVINFLGVNRAVTIKGIPGIGKSVVVKQVSRYIYERGKFRDGVIYMQIEGLNSIQSIVNQLSLRLFQDMFTEGSAKPTIQKLMVKIIQELKELRILIIFDNCDSILNSKEKSKFKKFLQKLLQHCEFVKFIFTARSQIAWSMLKNNYCQKIVNIGILNFDDSRQLFFKKTARKLTQQQQEYLKKSNKDQQGFLRLFNGHPQAIALGAGLLNSESFSLKSLEYKLTNQPLLQVLQSQQISDQQKKSLNALYISLQLSWNIIKQKDKDAVRLFGMMGMLPGGATQQLVQKVFPVKWSSKIQLLKKYSLICDKQKHKQLYYVTHTFIGPYASYKLSKEDKQNFQAKILQHLLAKLQIVQRSLGTLSPKAQKAKILYQNQQVNIRACALREHDALFLQQKQQKGVNLLASSWSNTVTPQGEQKIQGMQNLSKKGDQVLQNIFDDIGQSQEYESSREEDKENQDSFLAKIISNDSWKEELEEEKEEEIFKDNFFLEEKKEFYQDQLMEEKKEQKPKKTKTEQREEIQQKKENKVKNKSIIKSSLEPVNKTSKSLKSKIKGKETKKVQVSNHSFIKKGLSNILKFFISFVNILYIHTGYNDCKNFLTMGLSISNFQNCKLSKANFWRIDGCLYLNTKSKSDAKKCFMEARRLFMQIGCSLGKAQCQAALGYIFYTQQQFSEGKYLLQQSLKGYQNLKHKFGLHYLNRWLYRIKSKLYKTKVQIHLKQANKLIKQAQQALKTNKLNLFQQKHTVGKFIFRYMHQYMSLFLEPALEIDTAPYSIVKRSKETNLKRLMEKHQNQNCLKKIDEEDQLQEELKTFQIEDSLTIKKNNSQIKQPKRQSFNINNSNNLNRKQSYNQEQLQILNEQSQLIKYNRREVLGEDVAREQKEKLKKEKQGGQKNSQLLKAKLVFQKFEQNKNLKTKKNSTQAQSNLKAVIKSKKK